MTLWERFERARRSGALVYYASELVGVRECSKVNFETRYCPALRQKDNLKESSAQSTKRNPFLPPEEELVIARLDEEGYILLFNKFCIVRNHLLLITANFINQEELLRMEDFIATDRTLELFEKGKLLVRDSNADGTEGSCNDAAMAGWLLFYNSGRESGASQSHRHLQMIPNSQPPIDAAINEAIPSDTIFTIRPFEKILHGVIRFEGEDGERASRWFDAYKLLCQYLDVQRGTPYNLLFTTRWMMIVRRKCNCFDDISLNALFFAGYFLARSPRDIRLLESYALQEILTSVAEAKMAHNP